MPRNRQAWADLGSPIGDNILLEQYLLAACLRFHKQTHDSQYRARLPRGRSISQPLAYARGTVPMSRALI